MNTTNEQAGEIRDGLYSEYPVWRNCDEKGRPQFITAGELAADLLEAYWLIKEMRDRLLVFKGELEEYNLMVSGEQYNSPSLNNLLEKSKDYAE